MNEHRQTSAHHTHAVLRIQRLNLLLTLERIVFVLILLIDFFYLRTQHALLCTAHKALARGGEHNGAQNQRDEHQNKPHREVERSEEVENVDGEETVYPTHNRPTQIHQLLQVNVLSFVERVLVHRLEQAEIIGTEIPLELRWSFARSIKDTLHLRTILLEITTVVLLIFAFTREFHVGERRFSNEARTEILILESNPFEVFFDLLLIVTTLFEVVATTFHIFITECGVLVFKIESLFKLTHVVSERNAHCLSFWRHLL